MNPLPMYDNVGGQSNALPVSFGDSDQSDDINELMDMGWMFPNDKY